MAQSPLPPVPGVVEVKMNYLNAGQVLQNTYHVHSATTWDPVSLLALGSLFATWETSDARAVRGTGVSLVSVRLTDLTSPVSAYAVLVVSPAIAGTAVGELLPANVTLAVQASTGRRGRGEQGRIFWIGLTEGMTQGSVIDPTITDAIIAAMNNLGTIINGTDDYQMVVVHRQNAGLPLNPGTTSSILQWLVADTTTDSQKNRLPNHKRHKRPAA